MTSPTSAMPPHPTEEPKTCPCGFSVGHPLVVGEAKYSLFHYCLGLFMGSSAGDPRSVEFRCARCGTLVAESTDREVCLAHRH